jgi:hypothetical protein
MLYFPIKTVLSVERSLRVKAGHRNAKAKGKRLGGPKAVLDAKRIATSVTLVQGCRTLGRTCLRERCYVILQLFYWMISYSGPPAALRFHRVSEQVVSCPNVSFPAAPARGNKQTV